MSTNFYLIERGTLIDRVPCYEVGELYIEKSAGGWYFSLHANPSRGIVDLRSRYNFMRRYKNAIRDKYGEHVRADQMLTNITKRRGSWKGVPANYTSEEQLLENNCAEFGINGLLSFTVDGIHCIGHASATYSIKMGESSQNIRAILSRD